MELTPDQKADVEAIARALRTVGTDGSGHVATAYVAESGALVVIMDPAPDGTPAYRLTPEPMEAGE